MPDENVKDFEKEKDKRTIFRVVKNKENPYVQIHKSCLNDNRLSLKAKGLMAYMLSKPDDWVFYRDKIVGDSADGIDSVKAAIKELKKYSYIKIVPEHDQDGRFIRWMTLVFEEPVSPEAENPLLDKVPESRGRSPEVDFPVTGFATCGKSTPTNTEVITNTDLQKTTTTTNQDTARDPEPSADVVVVDLDNELVRELKKHGVNPHDAMQYVRNYGEARVREVIQLCDEKPRDNPAGFIAAAFRKGWTMVEKQKSTGLISTKELPTKDEVISHIKTAVWPNLSDLEKIEKLEYARDINLVFDHMFKHSNLTNQDVLLTSFMDTGVFSFMIEILYPTPTRS